MNARLLSLARPALWRLPSRLISKGSAAVIKDQAGGGKNSSLVSINKLLSEKGLCSRREAEQYIKKGWVRLNGKFLGKDQFMVDPSLIETLELANKASRDQTQRATILLNKPLGIVSCQPECPEQIPAVQLLTNDRQYKGSSKNIDAKDPRSRKGWAVAGRLDMNSTGLLVLTQSGKIARDIIGPDSTMEKEYLVRLEEFRTHNYSFGSFDQQIDLLLRGIEDEGDWLEAVTVEQIQTNQLKFVLNQGKTHHIRRMCRAVGLPLKAIKRVRIGNVVLGDLPVGQWKYMSPHLSFTDPKPDDVESLPLTSSSSPKEDPLHQKRRG